MIIWQTIWICEICEVVVTIGEKARMHDDPVINPPEGWDYVVRLGHEKLACPDCARSTEGQ